jgi:hypothetical protein
MDEDATMLPGTDNTWLIQSTLLGNWGLLLMVFESHPTQLKKDQPAFKTSSLFIQLQLGLQCKLLVCY